MNPKVELLKNHIKKLNNLHSRKTIFVVEGKNDARALRQILKVNILALNKVHKSLYETAEMLAKKYSRVILLFDADRKGKTLSNKMKCYLQMNGVTVKTEEKLLKLANRRNVEGLSLKHLVFD